MIAKKYFSWKPSLSERISDLKEIFSWMSPFEMDLICPLRHSCPCPWVIAHSFPQIHTLHDLSISVVLIPVSQFSRSVMSNSLWPHGLQHVRPPCPSPTPGAYSNSCPLTQWCHPNISSSVVSFSTRLQYFPAIQSFPMSQFLASSHQRIDVSASASVLLMNIQDLIHVGWTGWISPCSPRDSQESSPTPQFKSINSSVLSFLYGPTLTSIHDYWKNQSFD